MLYTYRHCALQALRYRVIGGIPGYAWAGHGCLFTYLFGWLVGLGWVVTCEKGEGRKEGRKGFGDGHPSGMVRTPDYGCWVGGRAGFSTV